MNVSLQISDLPDAMPSSKLAYWQSEALSRDLSAQAGSQSQLNAQQLVSCPSLLAATLVSDPAVVMVPLQSPPKRSAVVDWLRQLNYGQPIDSKHVAKNSTASKKAAGLVPAASNMLPVDYGQPVDSKQILKPNKNMESADGALSDVAKQHIEAVRTENPRSDVGQRKIDENSGSNDRIDSVGDDDDGDVKKGWKSLLRRRECRVSFLADVGQTEINSAGLLADDGSDREDEDDLTVGRSHSAGGAAGGGGGDGGGDLQKAEEQQSSMSNSTSVLFCTQPSSSGQSLPKASFIDLEVPDSWRSHRQSQMSDGSRHSGSVEIPPHSTTMSEAAAASVHVASTPTTSSKGRQGGEDVNLSVISCSPITPRTTSDKALRTRFQERTDSPSVEARNEEDEDSDNDLTVIPCSPIIPFTSTQSGQQQYARNRTYYTGTDTDVGVCHHGDEKDDDDIVVIPCTPITPTLSQTVDKSSCGKVVFASAEGQQDGKPEDEAVTVVPCSPITPTTVPIEALKNRPVTGIQGIPHFKVILRLILYVSGKLICVVLFHSSFVLICHDTTTFFLLTVVHMNPT